MATTESGTVETKSEVLWEQTKEKIDKAALAKAQIKNGIFDWAGTEWEHKKPPRHNDGTPRAPIKILLKAGDWSENNGVAAKYFQGEYFKERYAFHMMRLDGGYKQALAEITKDGTALSQLSEGLFQSLMADLQDEDRARKIPFRDRYDFYVKVTDLQSKLKGDAATRHRSNISIGALLINAKDEMEPGEYERRVAELDRVSEDVSDIVDGVITGES